MAEVSIVQDFVAPGVCFNTSNFRLRSAMACIKGTNSFSRSRQLTPGVLGFGGPIACIRLFLWPDVRLSLPAMQTAVLQEIMAQQ